MNQELDNRRMNPTSNHGASPPGLFRSHSAWLHAYGRNTTLAKSGEHFMRATLGIVKKLTPTSEKTVGPTNLTGKVQPVIAQS